MATANSETAHPLGFVDIVDELTANDADGSLHLSTRLGRTVTTIVDFDRQSADWVQWCHRHRIPVYFVPDASTGRITDIARTSRGRLDRAIEQDGVLKVTLDREAAVFRVIDSERVRLAELLLRPDRRGAAIFLAHKSDVRVFDAGFLDPRLETLDP
jgi:hypothetical protein